MSMDLTRPGSIVFVWIGLLKHPGIWTGCGTVITCSFDHGKVVERPVADFANGKRLMLADDYGQRLPVEVVAAARSEIGRSWNLFTNNCEHFVNRAHGLAVRSPQLEAAAAIVLMLGTAWCLRRARA